MIVRWFTIQAHHTQLQMASVPGQRAKITFRRHVQRNLVRCSVPENVPSGTEKLETKKMKTSSYCASLF